MNMDSYYKQQQFFYADLTLRRTCRYERGALSQLSQQLHDLARDSIIFVELFKRQHDLIWPTRSNVLHLPFAFLDLSLPWSFVGVRHRLWIATIYPPRQIHFMWRAAPHLAKCEAKLVGVIVDGTIHEHKEAFLNLHFMARRNVECIALSLLDSTRIVWMSHGLDGRATLQAKDLLF